MEEENNDKKIDTDEILKETSNTFNEVKDQVKGSFKKEELKNSAKETKNFIVEMFNNPIGELKNIANDSKNSNFKYAVILVVVWMVARFLLRTISYISSHVSVGTAILSIIKSTIAPILIVFILALIVMIMNKKKDKSLITILTVVTAAKLPVVISSVFNLLRLISSKVTTITSPFASLCSVISTVLVFFGIKFLYNEEDDKTYIKKFVIVEAIYYLAALIISFLDISI